MAKSADLDQTAPEEQTDLGLHCLLAYFFQNYSQPSLKGSSKGNTKSGC